jgi:copper(I)-binding protein
MGVRRRVAALAIAIMALAPALQARAVEVVVTNAWVQSARAGAAATDAYMDLRADAPLRLVRAHSAWAERMEVRDDAVSGRASTGASGVEVPANKDMRLAPGGYHLALVGVAQDIANGASVPITLDFEDAAHVPHQVEVRALARGNMFPPGPPPPPLVR